MLTVIYDKEGNVTSIVGGKSNPDELIDMDKNCIYVESLPKYDMYRQALKVVNKKLTVVNLKLSAEKEKEIQSMEINSEIYYYKNLLAQTDYKTLKFVDGSISEEEYAPVKKERQQWRDKINELEKELSNL